MTWLTILTKLSTSVTNRAEPPRCSKKLRISATSARRSVYVGTPLGQLRMIPLSSATGSAAMVLIRCARKTRTASSCRACVTYSLFWGWCRREAKGVPRARVEALAGVKVISSSLFLFLYDALPRPSIITTPTYRTHTNIRTRSGRFLLSFLYYFFSLNNGSLIM